MTTSTSRTWFITGASRGMGRELVEQLLARGDTVAATLRRPEQINDLAARYPMITVAQTVDKLKDAGFYWATRSGVTVSMFGEVLAERDSAGYGAEGYVYQALATLPEYDGRRPVLGAWVVDGEPAGLGIR